MSISVCKREINDHEGNMKLYRAALKVIIHHYLTLGKEKFKILENIQSYVYTNDIIMQCYKLKNILLFQIIFVVE